MTQIAIVTGSSSGIGNETSLVLVRDGNGSSNSYLYPTKKNENKKNYCLWRKCCC